MELCQTSEKQSAANLVAQVRNVFNSGRTKPYEFRKAQLENMKKFLKDNAQQLCEVIHADLRYVVLCWQRHFDTILRRKPEQESYVTEIDYLLVEIIHILDNLKEWMQPEEPEKTLLNAFDKIRIYNDPLGVVLVMGAWNYPLQLTLCPVLGN